MSAARRVARLRDHIAPPTTTTTTTTTTNVASQSYAPATHPIVVVGGMAVDITARPDDDTKLILHTSNPGNLTQSCGGVGFNIARCIAHLYGTDGTKPILISRAGEDSLSLALKAECERLGISTQMVVFDETMRTATYMALLDESGSLLAAVADMDVLKCIGQAQIESAKTSLNAAPCVVVDANLAEEGLRALAETMATSTTPLWFEPVSVAKAAKVVALADRVTHLSPNEDELAALVVALETASYGSSRSVNAGGVRLRARDGHSGSGNRESNIEWGEVDRLTAALFTLLPRLSGVLVKLGGDGAAWYERGQAAVYIRPQTVESVVSVTGAGDSMVATLVWALFAEGLPIESAGQAATNAAVSTLLSSEAVAPSISRSTVLTFL